MLQNARQKQLATKQMLANQWRKSVLMESVNVKRITILKSPRVLKFFARQVCLLSMNNSKHFVFRNV